MTDLERGEVVVRQMETYGLRWGKVKREQAIGWIAQEIRNAKEEQLKRIKTLINRVEVIGI